MKICFFIHDMSKSGGTERVTSVIANALAKETGFEVDILSCDRGETSGFPLDASIELLSLHGERIGNPVLRKLKYGGLLKKMQKEHQWDVVICVDTTRVPFAKSIRKLTKIVAWEHFNYDSQQDLGHRMGRRMAGEFADAIVVLTKADQQAFRENTKGGDRVIQISNPLTLEPVGVSALDSKRVLAVGRLVPQKGFDLLLKAWKLVSPQLADWTLRIQGSGEDEASLRAYMTENKLERVEIVPFSDDIAQAYVDANLFVLSSRFEGFGLVLIEAQISGVPLVAFDCKYGPSEIIEDGVSGLLVPAEDVEKLALAIARVAEDPALQRRFQEAGLESSKAYQLEPIKKQWVKLLYAVVSK